MTPIEHREIVVMGGGLAGLTLALQLKRRHPDLDIQVIERRAHPVPEAAHKIGESSVEIAAHYFSEVLGMKELLKEQQLKKFGFRFFFSDGQSDLASVTELGASTFLPTGSWQIDRGIFENSLGKLVRDCGVRFSDSAMIREFTVAQNEEPHQIVFEQDGIRHELRSRWLIDASGRAGLIKRKLGLADANSHEGNAVWFRIAERINVDDWSDDAEFLSRCDPPHRWLSTIHLVGEGYWVWLIPLASGSHSVGIVCDPNLHPIERMSTFEAAMQWLSVHQPKLHSVLDGKRDKLQDFAFFKQFSYGCKKVFSGSDRWAMTGEAGVFLDPFYSPGSDFIAFANTFITEMVTQDRAKRPVDMYASIFERTYLALYDGMLPLYSGQYGLFRDAEILPIKVIWDYTFYWGIMCPLFFQNKLVDISAMGRITRRIETVQRINVAVQSLLRRWGEMGVNANPRRMIDQASLPWFAELNRGLTDKLDNQQFDDRLDQSVAQLEQLADEIVQRALTAQPALDVSEVSRLVKRGQSSGKEPMLFALAA